jgi:hypothetical protein
MRINDDDIFGGFNADATSAWASADCVNMLVERAEGPSRSPLKLVGVPGLKTLCELPTLPGRGSHEINGRMFVVPFDEPLSVYYSKKRTAGYAYEFTGGYFKVDIQGGSKITGLASHGGNVYIFTSDGIYSIYGDGPDDLGNNPYLAPQRIANVGAEERSILVTPQGIAFRRPKRGWAILAGNQVQPLPPVTYGYESQTVRACAYNEVENLWHYQLSTNHLAFDPEHQAWYQWTWAHAETPVDFCATDGTLVQVASASLVMKQGSVYTDNSVTYGMTIQTPWVKLDGLAGYGRLYEVRVVGQDLSANTVRLDLYSDFGTSSDQNGSNTASGAGQLGVRLHVLKQKITAVLAKLALTAASTAGVAITAIELVYGVKARKPYSTSKSL